MRNKTLRWVVVLVGAALLLSIFVTGCQGAVGPAGPPGSAGAAGAPGPAGPPGTSAGTIEGKVLSAATGKGVEKLTIVTVPGTVSATTDAEGKYKLDNLPIGLYTVKASGTGYNTASAKVAVIAGKSAAVNLSLSAAEPFALAVIKAVSNRTADKDTYPEGKLALTTHYAIQGQALTHGENVIKTSGTSNVPMGSYVYLQGKDTDAAGKKLGSWSWSVVGPGESKITVENASGQTPRFKADAMGKYEVTITATSEDGKKSSSELVIYASSYVGASTCISCHNGSVMPDNISEWQQTGHATKLATTYASYSQNSDYCIACHTTGYDESDKAGGFDDLAKQAGWDPKKSSLTGWLLDNKWTIDQITNSVMGKLANVQCEACHGPGQVHQGIVNSVENASLYNPGVCSQCHPQELQWRNSGHANTGYKNMHTAEGTSCVPCHTGQGFVQVTVRGQSPVFPNMATSDQPANLAEASLQQPIACATCHDPHVASEPFQGASGMASKQLRMSGKVTMPNRVTVDAKESALCVSCHADKRDLAYKADYSAGKNQRGAHDNTQADVFYGVSAAVFTFGGSDYTSTPHSQIVKGACIDCHMAPNPDAPAGAKADYKEVISSHGKNLMANEGGHSWSMTGTYQGKELENLAACTSCHKDLTTFNRPAFGDYDGNGKIEGIQTEVEGLLKLVAAQLPKDSSGAVLSSINATNTTELQRQALWNYAVITNDKSNGIHNAGFAVQVLQRTYKQLTGKDVLGATIR